MRTSQPRRAPPPAAFAAVAQHKSIEGFLFPATSSFAPTTTAAQLISDQLLSFTYAWRSSP